MRVFSILQDVIETTFVPAPNGYGVRVELGEAPDDSSVVRMRLVPTGDALPENADAIELEFDRHGRERSRTVQPRRYPAWDRREREVIEAELAARDVADANAALDEAEPADEMKPIKKGKLAAK